MTSELESPACPICGRPSVIERTPFCSTRCAQIDLGRWLKDVYRVETDELPDNESPD